MRKPDITAEMVATVACPICGNDSRDEVWKIHSYGYARCRACGLFYQCPRVIEPVMQRHYAHRLERSTEERQRAVFDPTSPQSDPILRDYRRTLERALPHAPGQRLLEVGCGQGALLYSAREIGLEPLGIEVGEDFCNLLREKLGLKVLAGDVLGVDLAEEQFDVIVIRHVLEHLHRLHETCRRLFSLLVPGGILLVEVPNIDGIEYRFRRALSSIGIGRPIWERMNIPEHLVYFSPRTLKRLMNQHGFEVVRWETYSHAKRHTRPGLAVQGLRHAFRLGNKMRFILRRPVREPGCRGGTAAGARPA